MSFIESTYTGGANTCAPFIFSYLYGMEEFLPRKKESGYIRGICVLCERNQQCSKGMRDGKRRYSKLCACCSRNRYKKAFNYRKHKKSKCEKCGFIPINTCQLDVDHIDGNHKNNDASNLQTLCANCHRLKTHNDRKDT